MLKTYDREYADGLDGGVALPWPFTIIGGCNDLGCDELKPGDWVQHHHNGGRGMVVAITSDQCSILWSETPKSGFENIVFPIIRRVYTPLIAPQLVSVQPLSSPAGSIFYMDYAYESELDRRCKEGPWWGKMYWRTKRWLKHKTSSLSSSLSSWWRSRFTRRSLPRLADDQHTKEVIKKFAKMQNHS